jgi:hypothetical protein
VIDIRIGLALPFMWIKDEVPSHVLVDFFLKVDPYRAVDSNDFVRADSGIGGDIAAGVRNSYVGRNVANGMMCALNRGCDQSLRECYVRRSGTSLRATNRAEGQ